MRIFFFYGVGVTLPCRELKTAIKLGADNFEINKNKATNKSIIFGTEHHI